MVKIRSVSVTAGPEKRAVTREDDPNRRIEVLRERISALSAASLRIGSSLDLDTVLRGIADSARALTGARYAVITTVDDAGQLDDVVMSGFTPAEQRRVEAWDDSMGIFAALRDLDAPLRVADMPAYVAGLGFSTDGVIISSFQGMPMRHLHAHIGNFFLGEKAGGPEFTDEDEELLVLFASQAAAAVANARTHRAERRARAGIEALVETSPYGVAVFDVPTGRPVSLNREARRIMGGLRTPGEPVERLLEAVTCRLADGREIALDRLSLGAVLSDAQPVRAEEIELSVPDGRSVTTLLNATPIHSPEGPVESVVVTLQDLAPLRELERQRAAFLEMVSHELRAPLSAVKGSAATLVETAATLDRAEVRAFSRIIVDQADHMRGLIGDLLDAGRLDSGTLSVAPEPTQVAALVDRARNTFLAAGSGHDVLIDLAGDLPPVMADRPRVVQVLNNLLANAARHSPERSPIRVDAVRDGVRVAVSVRDEGRGIAPDRLARLFRRRARIEADDADPGAGIGLGLAICKGLVEAHGGRIRAASGGPGQGASFTFTLPAAGERAEDAWRTPGPPSARGRERPRILVVDDDPQTLRFVRDALADADYDAHVTGDHHDLPALIDSERPDLVLLDLMLPDGDGIELMGRVSQLAEQPVIFISAYGRDETVAQALACGAADYVVKPFSATELVARIGAALRGRSEPAPFVLGDLAIRYDDRSVTLAGRPVELTAMEFDLLRALSANAGRVSTYDALLRQVWSGRDVGGAGVVRAFVKRLRRKLRDDPKDPAYIFNHRGVGYRMPRPNSG
ncbi:MAG: response regulator [Gammaproteobacteria bacterium]|nr:response regulator [Gammaproteobacteria bacterium]